MKSKVYFVAVNDANNISAVNEQLKKLIEKSGVLDFIRQEYKVAVKAHFGEAGNTGFIRPQHMAVICRAIIDKGAKAIVSDANTLYRGRRLNSKDHLELAYEHGFTKDILGVDAFIPDDDKNEDIIDVSINQKYVKTAKLARFFVDADAVVAVNHFKGHILTGFGGALKNIGMGCATRKGKLAQHCDVAPVVFMDKCVGCAECEKICPVGAIHMENKKASLDKHKCIGCASCIAACPNMAMFIDIEAGDKVQEKIAEYCLAVLKNKKSRACFFNFAIRINQECDCWAMENPRIAPDVGILASFDPVSLDKASFDVVNEACGKDIFKEVHPKQNSLKQLEYAQRLGLGSLDYELIRL